jgi:hypothetical protein
MLATLQFRIFCPPISFVRTYKIKIYKNVILPFVLYDCESWSVTQKEEHRLRMFENRVLRRVFGLKREDMVVGWRRLHNEEFHNLSTLPSIFRV